MDKDREKQERDAVAVSPSQAERSPRGNLKGKRRSEEKKQSCEFVFQLDGRELCSCMHNRCKKKAHSKEVVTETQ